MTSRDPRPRRPAPGGVASPYLPKDTRQVLERAPSGVTIHPGLLLQRFLSPKGDRSASPGIPPIHAESSFEGLLEVGRGALRTAVELMASRADLLRDALRRSGLAVEERILRVGWRLTGGLGSEHPAEIGFTLHRMGFPYLPATGLKGLAREVAERTLPPTRVRHLFGDQSGRGAARFLDALPVPGDGPYVELDVMNPHVPAYYQGQDWPREWMGPIPLVFLAVPRGVRFRFLVAAGEASDAREAMDLLVQGLTTWGAAAKRAAGYGWMEPVDDG